MALIFNKPTYQDVFQYVQFGRLHHLILGGGDSGKTNFLMWFFYNCPYRVIVMNSLGHIDFRKYADITIYEDKIPTLWKGLDMTVNGKYKYMKINVEFTDRVKTSLDTMREYFEQLCERIFFYEDKQFTKYMKIKGKTVDVDFHRKANIILLVDETLDFTEKESFANIETFLRIIREGRNHNILLFCLTQRNQYIPKWLTIQSKTKYLFEMDRYDIARLTEFISHIEKVEDLPEFHFIVTHGLREWKAYSPVPLMKSD